LFVLHKKSFGRERISTLSKIKLSRKKRGKATDEGSKVEGAPPPWFASEKYPKRALPADSSDEEDKLSKNFDVSIYLENGALEETFQDDGASDDEEEHFQMDRIPDAQVGHWKHVIYNLLVDNHNNPKTHRFCVPLSTKMMVPGSPYRHGFRFDVSLNPQKRLAELWARHEKHKALEDSQLLPVFKDDLYKFYLRACLDLLAKYFIKQDKFTFYYDEIPLFVPNGSLEDALERLKTLPAKNRKITPSTKKKQAKSGRKEEDESKPKKDESKPKKEESKQPAKKAARVEKPSLRVHHLFDHNVFK